MKKLTLSVTLISILSLTASINAQDNQGSQNNQDEANPQAVTSLRGKNAIANEAKDPKIKKWINNDVIVKRQFVQQPPLIPHSVENYKVTFKSNKCMTCHSWQNAAESGATKISLTHYTDRDGKELSDVSARRYFCTQCHVPQKNAKPLIVNDYQPVNSLK